MSAFIELVILPAVLPLLVVLVTGRVEAWLEHEQRPENGCGTEHSVINSHSA